jgi:hypothetical protein
MPNRGLVTSKVRAYMEALSPNARAMLVRAIRSSAHRDSEIPADILLAAVEGLELDLDPHEPAASTAGDPSWREKIETVFFEPVQPLCVAAALPTKQAGRVHRASLGPIWTWMIRDVLPRDFERAFAQDPRDGRGDPEPVARKLRRDATERALQLLREAEGDAKQWHRMAWQIGGDAVARDLKDVLYVFQREAAVSSFIAQLPRVFSILDVTEPGTHVMELVRATVNKVQIDSAYVGSILLGRAGSPALLATMAMRLAGTDDARAVHAGPYARLVEIVLSEPERMAVELSGALDRPAERAKALPLLRDFHDLVRQIALSVELEDVSPWLKRLGAARKSMSERVGKELEQAPDLIRRALPVESLVGSHGGGFDQAAFEDAEFALRLLGEARAASDSLAVNDVVGRTRKAVEQTLETISGKLLADLKSKAAFDRRALIEAVDGSIKLTALVFGDDYAAVLRKSRDHAVQRPAKLGA